METVTAPPAAAPVAAAPSAPAPASTPAAAAPVTETKAAPEVGSPEFFSDAMAKVPAEEAPATEEVKVDPAKSVVVEETAEQKAAKEALAAETPEAKLERETKEAEAARIAAQPPANQAEIDLGESIAPAALLESIDKAPDAVKEWFNDPENPLKDTLTNMARRAAVADPILRQIPDVETAERLVQTGAEYEAFDNSFDQISDTKSALDWWQKMTLAQAQKDATGKLTMHPAFRQLERTIVDANLQSLVSAAKAGKWHPALSNVFHDALEVRLDAAKKAVAAGQDIDDNQDAIVAIENLQRVNPRPVDKPVELTPEQKTAQAQIDRDRAAIKAGETKAHTQKVTDAFSTVTKTVDESMADQFVPAIQKAGLAGSEFEHAVLDIANALEAELETHDYYKERKAQIKAAIQKNPTDANIAALKKHELTYRNMKIGKITKEVLRKATEGKLVRQGEKQEKIEAQTEASKTEPRGTSTATPAIQVKGNTISDSQAIWDADPKNMGATMPMVFHFNRIMTAKK